MARTSFRSTSLDEVAAMSNATDPVAKADSTTITCTMNPDSPSMAPWVTATAGVTPYLNRNAAFIVTRPATPGMANEMNAMALCRMVAGRSGSDRPTANIIEAAWGMKISWPSTSAAMMIHQIASCSSAHSWA